MSSIAEWLQRQGPETEQRHGVTTLDLADLPSTLRIVSRLILRETALTYPALCEAVAALPIQDRLNRAELDEALHALVRQKWLLCSDECQSPVYKINLRRRAGHRARRSAWAALENE